MVSFNVDKNTTLSIISQFFPKRFKKKEIKEEFTLNLRRSLMIHYTRAIFLDYKHPISEPNIISLWHRSDTCKPCLRYASAMIITSRQAYDPRMHCYLCEFASARCNREYTCMQRIYRVSQDARVFISCRKDGKLLHAFEELNKRNKGQSFFLFFRFVRRKLHRSGIVFVRLPPTRGGYALRKEVVFLRFERWINASVFPWREQRTGKIPPVQ